MLINVLRFCSEFFTRYISLCEHDLDNVRLVCVLIIIIKVCVACIRC